MKTEENSPVQRAIGYCRVSTNRQDNSLDAQEHKIRGMAALKGYDLVDVVIDRDEFSGTLQRPGVDKIIGMIKRQEIDAVIVAKLDRLTRSTRDAITLMELCSRNKVAMISLNESLDTSSPMGRFVVKLFASLAELERETICERISVGIQNLKRHKLPSGTAPYGWTNVGKKKPLAVNEAERAVVSMIVAGRAEGKTMKEIADGLNELGLRTRKGGLWKLQYVDAILRKEKEEDSGQSLCPTA